MTAADGPRPASPKRPAEYLAGGFFTEAGERRPGIDGEHSLATAYRVRDDQVSPEAMLALAEELEQIYESDPEVELDGDIPEATLGAIDAAFARAGSAPALAELLAAARPVLRLQRDVQAFVGHARRIAAQLALLATVPKLEA